MAYQNAQFTNVADLMGQLETFAVANGWTSDYSASDRLFLTKSTCSVAFRWASSSPTGIAIYQHTAFINSATDPGNHTNDSGQGAISSSDATLMGTSSRSCPVPNTGGQYWFFEDDTYIHVVVETSAQQFSHFGFGILTKFGTWTGGEYSYGWKLDNTIGTGANATLTGNTFLLDGRCGITSGASYDQYCATVHMESLPNQTASTKWGIVWAGGAANTGTDRAALARMNVQGGFRGGPVAESFGRFGGAASDGLVPMYPINLWYDDPTTTAWYPIGQQPDVRGMNVKYFLGGDEVVIGSDTWVVFPARYKNSVSATGSTRNLGMAYKKVV